MPGLPFERYEACGITAHDCGRKSSKSKRFRDSLFGHYHKHKLGLILLDNGGFLSSLFEHSTTLKMSADYCSEKSIDHHHTRHA